MHMHKDQLYSCSFNKIHIWKGHDDFKLIQEKETSFGAIYSMATTKKYLITGVCVFVCALTLPPAYMYILILGNN